MARNPKSFDQALLDLARLLWLDLGQEPDLVEGSGTRSLLEAVAFQAADLSARQEASIDAAVPEAVFRAFGFARREAAFARVPIRVTLTQTLDAELRLYAGSEAFTDDGRSFVLLADLVVAVGQTTAEGEAIATEAGVRGNVPANAVRRFAFSPPELAEVTNPEPARGGRAAETPAKQAARFARWLAQLDQSTRAGLADALREYERPDGERLDACKVVDADDDANILPGRFVAYVYRLGGVSAALLDGLRDVVAARRAAGALGLVIEVPGTPVPVTATIQARATGTLPLVREAIGAYFANLALGQKVSFENLVTVITTASPDVLEVTLAAPAADVPPSSPYTKFEAGLITLTEVLS